MKITHSIYQLVFLTLLFTVFAGYSFMFADAPADPPANNVAAPINVGASAQIKSGDFRTNGDLVVDKTMTVTGTSTLDGDVSVNGAITIVASNPRIRFDQNDAGIRDWWLYGDNNNFYLLADRGNDGSFTGDTPYPMQFFTDTDATNDFVKFSNEVRAESYCDAAGTNCSDLVHVNNYCPTCAGGGSTQISSRNYTSALDSPSDITYYAGDVDTANYFCREQYDLPFGYWRTIYAADSGGWGGYGNLAVATAAGGYLHRICTDGNSCVSMGARYGRDLYCYATAALPAFTPGAF